MTSLYVIIVHYSQGAVFIGLLVPKVTTYMQATLTKYNWKPQTTMLALGALQMANSCQYWASSFVQSLEELCSWETSSMYMIVYP